MDVIMLQLLLTYRLSKSLIVYWLNYSFFKCICKVAHSWQLLINNCIFNLGVY